MSRNIRRSIRASLRSLNISLRSKRRGRRPLRRFRTSDHWRQIGDHTFTKLLLSRADRAWLKTLYPEVRVTLETVAGHEQSQSFKTGHWNGRAWVLRFPKDQSMVSNFRSDFWV